MHGGHGHHGTDSQQDNRRAP
ncbi:MAG: hypothetical protein E6833_14625 [Bradyrhizobium sp.]|nr:hypothetical protein [Bradyrhizobium sp.]